MEVFIAIICIGGFAGLIAFLIKLRKRQIEKTKEALNSLIGATKAQLIASWGDPTRVTDDGNGGEILIYSSTYTTGGHFHSTYNNGHNYTYYDPPQTVTDKKQFFIDAKGIIYKWMWN
jgi:uncharacterized membrane protein YeaQ/YmgE (transglycosylase-associated protein family)